MRKQYLSSIVPILLCALSGSVLAGQIHLINGDRLSGTVLKTADGIVTVQTDLAGEVKVPLANIRSIQSDEPVRLQYPDGRMVEQPLTETTDLSAVSAINPPEPEKPRWKGEITGAAIYTTGNTNNESYSFSTTLSKRTDLDRITLKGDLARQKERTDTGDKEVTENWWRVGGKYDYFLSEKWYLFGEGRYETDTVADLNRRIIYGGGLGYQWIDTKKTHLALEAGLAAVQESYDDGQGTNTTLSASTGYHFDHQFSDTFSFISDLTYYPSTEQVSDYYLTSNHELRARINDHLFSNFRVLFDYDATPAQDQGSTDVKYIFGIGANF